MQESIWISNIVIIIIGTAAGTGHGGISTALPGYFDALKRAGIAYEFIVSHEGGSPLHKLKLFVGALRSVAILINREKDSKLTPVLYVHTGPWFSMLRKLALIWVGKLLGAKVICQVHSLSINRYLSHVFGRLYCRFFFSQVNQVLVLTEWWRSCLAEVGVANLIIVPNPLPASFERVARQSRIYPDNVTAGNKVRLLAMTRLVSGKGVDLAIKSLAHLPEQYQLTIAGTGPCIDELKNIVAVLGLEKRVTFLGWVNGEARLDLFKKHDIFVSPTQNDSFGMGFIEAMAFGLPVVALDWGPIADVVPKDKAGFLIEKPNAVLLAKAVIKLESLELRRKMGLYGKQWVLQQFSIDSVAIKLGNVVSSLLDKSKS